MNLKALALSLLTAATLGLTGCAGESTETAEKDAIIYNNHLDQAEFYLKQGELKASILEARNALRFRGDAIEPYLIIIDSLVTSGDLKTAYSHLQAVETEFATAPQNTEFLALKADVELRLNETDAALGTIQQLNTVAGENSLPGLVLTARHALKTEALDDAEQALNKALALSDSHPETYLWLAHLAQRRSQPDARDQWLQQGLAKAPRDGRLWLLSARVAAAEGDLAVAEDAFIQALDEIGRFDIMTALKYQTITEFIDVLRQQSKLAEAYRYEEILAESRPGTIKSGYEEGLRLYKEKRYDEAATALEDVLTLAPEHNPSGLLLGVVRYLQGDLYNAQELLSRYIDDSSSPDLTKILAITQIQLDQADKAKALLADVKDEDTRALSLFGIAALASGDTEEGLETLERALSLEPENISLRLKLAGYHLRNDAFKLAETQAGEVLKRDAANYQARSLLISSWLGQGKLDAAQQQIEQWLKAEPGDSLLLNAAGAVQLVKKDTEQAQQWFTQALKADENNLTARINLAMLALNQGDAEAARADFRQVLDTSPENSRALRGYLASFGDDPVAITNALEALAAAHPQAASPRLALVGVLLEQGALDNALTQVRNTKPERVLLGRERDLYSTVYIRKIAELIEANQLAEARALLREGKSRFANENMGLSLIGAQIEFADNQPALALEIINSVKQQFPASSRPAEFEGDYYARNQQWQAALAAYQQAWDTNQSQTLAVKMHQIIKQLGGERDANAPLKEWLEINPDNTQALTVLAMGYQAAGQREDAIKTYESVRERSPNDAVALNNLAWLYFETGHPEAEATAAKAYEINNQNAAIADTYGWILLNKGEVERSIPLLEKAHALASNEPDIARHLREAYLKAGDDEKASQIEIP